MLNASVPPRSNLSRPMSIWRKRTVFLCLACLVANSILIADPCGTIHFFNGDNPGDWFGQAVDITGDVNNDGFADIICSSFLNDDGGVDAGAVYVFSGQTGDTLYVFRGEAGWSLGWSLAYIGDLNGDNHDDFIIGAGSTADGGRAFVFSGADGNTLLTIVGPLGSAEFGGAVDGAGDVNNDGVIDIIIGDHDNDVPCGNCGRAYLFSGVDGSLLHTFNGEGGLAFFGSSVTGVGDVDNDGCDDVAVGAPLYNGGKGRAYVFSGCTGDTIYIIDNPTAANSQLGIVSDGGDINNDGTPDVLVADWSGTALAVSGADGATIHTFTFGGFGGPTSRWIAAAGDVNGDNFADVAVAGRGYSGIDSRRGRVDICSGATGALLYKFDGEVAGDRFGHCISSSADVNADGKIDICVGAFLNDEYGADAGRVYVYSIDMGTDLDGDGAIDSCDNCPNVANSSQVDADADLKGDYCDNCPNQPNPLQMDTDIDGYGDGCDNCSMVANSSQADCDSDGIGDACDYLSGDADNNGVITISDAVYLINYVFSGGPAPCPLRNGDADCSGAVNISDAVYLINYIFAGGPAPC